MIECYLGLGSNLGDSYNTLTTALDAIKKLNGVFSFVQSRFFITTPVSDIAQNNFLNIVCKFNTTADVFTIHEQLVKIEQQLGKVAKQKNAPRPIDIDILFFGHERIETKELTIPHPEWMNRLFVLKPLSDLARILSIPDASGQSVTKVDLELLLENFINIHQEFVTALEVDCKES